MKNRSVLLTIGAVVSAALVVGACDSQEANRPLNPKKGEYAGKPHTPLSEETLVALRARAAYQAGPTAARGGGSGGGAVDPPKATSDVRPPAAAGINMEALRRRAANLKQQMRTKSAGNEAGELS